MWPKNRKQIFFLIWGYRENDLSQDFCEITSTRLWFEHIIYKIERDRFRPTHVLSSPPLFWNCVSFFQNWIFISWTPFIHQSTSSAPRLMHSLINIPTWRKISTNLLPTPKIDAFSSQYSNMKEEFPPS